VTPDYRPPFKFTGGLKRVRVDLSGEPFVDQVARFKAMMARQ
jgi:arylsulfatase